MTQAGVDASGVAQAVVVGGGFYGTVIAHYLAGQRGLKDVCLLEREAGLLRRASQTNQARVHNGYHYPRSFVTAYRSRENLPRFARDWPSSLHRRFVKLYAIARKHSKVTASQFARFCRSIDAWYAPAAAAMTQLFAPRLIEQVFEVEEWAFDSTALMRWAESQLAALQVGTWLSCDVRAVYYEREHAAHPLRVIYVDAAGRQKSLRCRYLFNCSYSGLNRLGGDFPGVSHPLKHELTEMALLKVPAPLDGLGITVMDGPFFSLMPYPARRLHSLSHVRYTPRTSWWDTPGTDAYQRLAEEPKTSRIEHMVRDVARYLPSIARASYADSMYEIKTVLGHNEVDDGRPILFERHQTLPGCYSILGAKIDNVYDVLARLDEETLGGGTACTMH